MTNHSYKFLFFIAVCLCLFACRTNDGDRHSVSVKIDIQTDSPRINHGISMIKALADSNIVICSDGKADIILTSEIDPSMGKEAFSITSKGRHARIKAGDDV